MDKDNDRRMTQEDHLKYMALAPWGGVIAGGTMVGLGGIAALVFYWLGR